MKNKLDAFNINTLYDMIDHLEESMADETYDTYDEDLLNKLTAMADKIDETDNISEKKELLIGFYQWFPKSTIKKSALFPKSNIKKL